ncbi:prolactin-like protein 2 precursor [Cavia porcellus]|uniref:Prolactin n=1 Tax=Cavia porcellus TaxID=10141 RepID=D9ZD70_CAVPO|nr:prolactin-like protein 2 precursor [Cavia porcellus]ADL32658.1 prolactin-like protein 2 [Cavia porcellus]
MDGKRKASLLLILLMSSLFLGKSMALKVICGDTAGCFLPLPYLFDRAALMSGHIHFLSSELFKEFGMKYPQNSKSFYMQCHTFSIASPTVKTEALKLSYKEFINLLIHLLHSWNEPLKQLIKEAHRLAKAPQSIVTKVENIRRRTLQLLEGLKIIGRQVNLEITNNRKHAVWSGLPFLRSSDEKLQQIAFHNLVYCLLKDAHRIHTYLNVMKCRITSGDHC